jgi:hypothetical protein
MADTILKKYKRYFVDDRSSLSLSCVGTCNSDFERPQQKSNELLRKSACTYVPEGTNSFVSFDP